MEEAPKFYKGDDIQYAENSGLVYRRGEIAGKPVSLNDPLQVQVSPSTAKIESAARKTKFDHLTGKHMTQPRSLKSPSPCEARNLETGMKGSLITEPKRIEQAKSLGSDRSMDKSPLNPHFQKNPTDKVGSASPVSPSDKKGRSSRSNRNYADMSRMSKFASSIGNNSEKDGEIPPIVSCDPNDPTGEKLTGIFRRTVDLKVENSPKVPSLKKDYMDNHRGGSEGHRCKYLACLCFCSQSDRG